MKKQLFGIDIETFNGKTTVCWWRHGKNGYVECYEHCIQIKTESTYDRLFNILSGKPVTFVHPHPDYLAISYIF